MARRKAPRRFHSSMGQPVIKAATELLSEIADLEYEEFEILHISPRGRTPAQEQRLKTIQRIIEHLHAELPAKVSR